MIQIALDDRELRSALERLRRRVENTGPAMHDIGHALVVGARDRIDAGVDWTGNAFAPNSPLTLARKKDTRPLIRHGEFKGYRIAFSATNDEVVVFSSAEQAAVLQFGANKGAFGKNRRGAPIPWGDIPARRYLPITQEGRLDQAAQSLILEIIREHLAHD